MFRGSNSLNPPFSITLTNESSFQSLTSQIGIPRLTICRDHGLALTIGMDPRYKVSQKRCVSKPFPRGHATY